ncbi:MAG TPA: DUF1801 domain-containing protein [Trueperaceae bacterium]|nr:DUF1801 domain-containing protein [Trueperaceae bacterium]
MDEAERLLEDYVADMPAERRETVERLHRIIRRAAPDLGVRYWDYGGGLLGYGVYHYRTKSGLEGDWFALGVGNRKRYVSLYTNGIKDGAYLTEAYAGEMPGTKIGRSCFNIYEPELLDDTVIARLVEETLTSLPAA